MVIPHPHWITIEEYHQIEEQNSEVKYEYADGCVYAMAGGFPHPTTRYNHELSSSCR